MKRKYIPAFLLLMAGAPAAMSGSPFTIHAVRPDGEILSVAEYGKDHTDRPIPSCTEKTGSVRPEERNFQSTVPYSAGPDTSGSSRLLPSVMDSVIFRGILQTVACDFDEADATFRMLETRWPDHPAGYFYRAANLYYKLLDFETDDWKGEFEDLIGKATSLGIRSIDGGASDPWILFYTGSAFGYLGMYQAMTGTMLPGLLNARRGEKYMEMAARADSALYDAQLAIGTYLYWSSKYLRWFFWVPDRREEGMHLARRAVDKGKYSRWIGLNGLGYIFYDMGAFDQAAACFQGGLDRFPGTRFYLWGLADSYFRMGRFQDALNGYEEILASLVMRIPGNGYNEVVCRFKMVKTLMALERFEDALSQCDAILARKTDDKTSGRLKSRIEETQEFRQECLERLGRIQVIRR